MHESCVKEDMGQPSKPEGFSLWDRKGKQNPESLQGKEQDKILRKQADVCWVYRDVCFWKRFHGTSQYLYRVCVSHLYQKSSYTQHLRSQREVPSPNSCAPKSNCPLNCLNKLPLFWHRSAHSHTSSSARQMVSFSKEIRGCCRGWTRVTTSSSGTAAARAHLSNHLCPWLRDGRVHSIRR